MNRSLHVLVALAAGLGAYALLIPPVAAASDVEPVPAVILSYRTAVARAAPSVVTVHSGRTVSGRLPFTPRVLVNSSA